MTASSRMIKRCWVAAGLLAQETEEIEVEPPIANEEVILLRELTENYEK